MILSYLGKSFVEEMVSGAMSGRGDGKVGNSQVGETPSRGNVRLGNIRWGTVWEFIVFYS